MGGVGLQLRVGQPCAIAAQLRGGTEAGLVVDGVFHPSAPNTSGACGKPGLAHPFLDIRFITSAPARTIVYGRGNPAKRSVTFQTRDGKRYRAQLGPHGGFIFVFKGRLGPGPYKLALS